jgi:hypothetical protein
MILPQSKDLSEERSNSSLQNFFNSHYLNRERLFFYNFLFYSHNSTYNMHIGQEMLVYIFLISSYFIPSFVSGFQAYSSLIKSYSSSKHCIPHYFKPITRYTALAVASSDYRNSPSVDESVATSSIITKNLNVWDNVIDDVFLITTKQSSENKRLENTKEQLTKVNNLSIFDSILMFLLV